MIELENKQVEKVEELKRATNFYKTAQLVHRFDRKPKPQTQVHCNFLPKHFLHSEHSEFWSKRSLQTNSSDFSSFCKPQISKPPAKKPPAKQRGPEVAKQSPKVVSISPPQQAPARRHPTTPSPGGLVQEATPSPTRAPSPKPTPPSATPKRQPSVPRITGWHTNLIIIIIANTFLHGHPPWCQDF